MGYQCIGLGPYEIIVHDCRMRFVNVNNPNVQVVLLYEGELRIGESVWPAIVYQRGDRIYIRKKEEFLAKFRLVN